MKKEEIKKNKEEEVAIRVENLSKTFKIPHEKQTSLKGAAVNLLNSGAKGYETLHALKDIGFEVKKGEFFGIIGRNGSGKSTLLKILAGIYIPDKGDSAVTINGKLSPFLELGVGFNAELTGRENIFLGGTILGLTRKQIAEKYDKIVAFSELENFIDMKLKNYSSGMQVRLAFSLAINVEADILLMDEVLAVGDINFQAKCLTEFNKYRDMGKTVILVTHDVAVVQRYCGRAMLLRNGKIVKIDKAEEVGNEYIRQNMFDEEKRRVGEEYSNQVVKKSDLKIDKVAEITRAEFFDKDGNKKNTFKTGDDISIRVYFKQNKRVDKLNFGLAILNQEGEYAFGVNSINDKINTEKYKKNNYCQIDYQNIPLRSNVYHVCFAIYGKDDTIAYDYVPKLKTFKIFSEDSNFGITNIDYKWA